MRRMSKSMPLLLVGIVSISIIAVVLMTYRPFSSSLPSTYPPPDPYLGPMAAYPSHDLYPGPTEMLMTPSPTSTEVPKLVLITLEVTLDGLEGRDAAEFELLPGNQITSSRLASLGVILPKSKATNGKQTILVENIPVGIYKIILNAPPEYLRQPMGYEFGVSDEGEIINNPDRILNFKLIPPSEQSLPPCRLVDVMPETSTPIHEPKDLPQEGKEVCMAEGIIDISAPRMKPEPQRPLVSGEISGVSESTLVTFHIRTLAGREALTGTMMGNGTWQTVVTDASGVDYIITAEAEGYVSAPISYTIHLEGLSAYLVENGQVTGQEASHLDFHFEPK